MTTQQQHMKIIFNLWNDTYKIDPDDFDNFTDEKGSVINDYGEKCTLYYEKLKRDLESQGLLTK